MNKHSDNRVINGLWIGKHLSIIEILCISSYINCGHEFHLWVYEKPETALPLKTKLCDANLIIPESKAFSYRNTNQFGHGKGSWAGFSDIFRYKLLHDKGGWWTDMDVICLKYLDFNEEYVFRSHQDFAVIGNIMKCPIGSIFMQQCYNEASKKVNENNTDWNLPIKILNENIVIFELQKYIKTFTNPDDWNFVKKLIYKNINIPEDWKAIHLLNEEWRKNKIIKGAVIKRSFIGKQIKHNIPDLNQSTKLTHIILNFYRAGKPDFKELAKKAYWFFPDTFWRTVRLIQRKFFNIYK